MSVEVSDVVVALAPADDVVVLIDPVELTPVAVTEPLPVELPEDGLTYVGPIDVHVDPFPIDPLPTDVALTDGSAGEGAPVDDGSIITTAVVDDVPTDLGVTDDVGIIACEDYPVYKSEDGDGAGPIDVHVDPFPIDPLPTDVALTDDIAGEGTPVDDGSIITTAVIDDVPSDIGVTDDGEVIGRPVDPEPNWRTLDGPADDGSISEGIDITVIACEDYPVYMCEIGDSAGPTDVIYTLDPADPLIYASATGAVDSPGRSPDPLPYERGATVRATVPESDPEIDRTPVHYAASDSFHTGLDLL